MVQNRGGDSEGDAMATGFAWNLYNHVFKLFTYVVPLTTRTSLVVSKKQTRALKESLGKLFLWGDGFRDGKLESILEVSDDLRETVLTSLIISGRVLTSKFVPTCQRVALSSIHDEIQLLVQELNILLEKAKLIIGSDYESGHESDGASDHDVNASAIDYDLEDSVNSLKICVACLMDLVPSMEDTLSYVLQTRLGDNKPALVPLQISGPARSSAINAHDSFANADCGLVERLGEANSETASGATNPDTVLPEAAKLLASGLDQPTVIIATDFGTTFSSVAFFRRHLGQTDRPRNITTYPNDPLANENMSFAVPTESCYTDESKISAKLDEIELITTKVEEASDIFDDDDNIDQLLSHVRNGDCNDEGEDRQLNEDPKIAGDEEQESANNGDELLSPPSLIWGYGAQETARFLGPNRSHFMRITQLKFILDNSPMTQRVRDDLRPILNRLKRRVIIRKDEDVIADYISQLFLHAKKQLILNHNLSDSDIVEHVLCVPNIWSSKACRTMQKTIEIAIRRSGLGILDNLFIVSESEAAATFVLHNNSNFGIKPGETFVIIDAGGGIVDATTYTVTNENPLRLKREAVEPAGGLFGSSYLNEAFRNHLLRRLEGEYYLITGGSTLEDTIDEAMIYFENVLKRSVDLCDNTQQEITAVLRVKIRGLRRNYQKYFVDHHILVSRNELITIFMPLLEGIVELIKSQIRPATDAGLQIQKVILIGGFAGSVTLREYVKTELKKLSSNYKDPIELFVPDSCLKTAVSLGGVLKALEKDDSLARITQSSYGFLRTEPHDPEEFQAHREVRPTVDKLDGGKYVRHTIDWIIKKGETLLPYKEFNITVIHTFPVWQKHFKCEEVLYVSDTSTESHYRSSHPKNKGAEEAGRIIADMTFLKTEGIIQPTYPEKGSRGKPHYKVKFELVMIIRGLNLRYEARYPAGGAVHGRGQNCIAAAFVPGTS